MMMQVEARQKSSSYHQNVVDGARVITGFRILRQGALKTERVKPIIVKAFLRIAWLNGQHAQII